MKINVSKEEFLTVYNKHLPSKWVEFVFKYFSKNTKKEDSWLSKILMWILIILFFIGFFGTVFHLPKIYRGIPTFSILAILIAIVGSMSSGAILNNLRLRKIRKELGISKEEYEECRKMYLE